MVAVAPGAAASSDSPSGDDSLDSLFDGSGKAEGTGSAGRARPAPSEARSTTIDLSAAADPVPRRRGVVSLRHIVGAPPPSGLWVARARRSARVGGWLVGAVTVSAGLVALWVLLFTTVSGGDVWLGRPLAPTKHDQNVTQQNVVPGVPGSPKAGTLRPDGTAPPKPSGAAGKGSASKAAAPSSTSGKSGSGSSGTGSGSGVSGRNGADDPPGDDSAGRGSSAPTTTATSGSGSGSSGGSGSGSGGSGSGSGGSGSGSGSGGHGADD